MTALTGNTSYTEQQVRTMLAAGADYAGTNTAKAAVHLILFTDLPAQPVLQRFLEIETVTDFDGKPLTGAWLNDYAGLRKALGHHLYSGLESLLTLAESIEEGTPVNLREVLPRFGGHAHAKVAVQACLIATGYADWYQVTGTETLRQHLDDPLSSILGPAVTALVRPQPEASDDLGERWQLQVDGTYEPVSEPVGQPRCPACQALPIGHDGDCEP